MSPARHFGVLIVGAGHAGAQTAASLRQHGYEGSIGLLGDEVEPPYDRPPLSKDYLSGEKTFERILLKAEAFWNERAIERLPGRLVVSVDPADHIVRTDAEEVFGYDHLVWATGGRARRLPCEGADLLGVHTIRSRADADRLAAELPDVKRVVVIGGGYIGLEAAAVLRKFDKAVTLLETQDRVLARVAGEPLSRFYEAEHRAHGVDLRLNVRVAGLSSVDGRVTGVRLADGEEIPADLVVVGIGVTPAVEPLIAAGAEGSDGVDVDAACRTSLPDVYAGGDCARHANPFADGARLRLESVQNANDQAGVAARAICGQDARYEAVPWFWSNQYDLRLQTIGLSTGADQTVIRGDPAARSFSVVYLKNGRVRALDCINTVKDYVQGKALVIAGARIPPQSLADAGAPLKELLAQASLAEAAP